MALSWRITTNLIDNTERASTSSPIIGATVIPAPKGPNKFYFFSKGETQKVVDTFGYPNKSYPAIQDALDIVAKSSMFVSSAYKNGKYGGVFITTEGTYPFVNGTTKQTIDDLSNISCEVPVAVGNSVLTEFTFTLPNFKFYKNSSLGIKVGAQTLTLALDDSDVETITDNTEPPLLTTGSQYTRSTGELKLVFSIAPSEVIVATYNIDMSSTLVTLYDANPQVDDLQVKITKSTDTDNALTMAIQRYNPVLEQYVDAVTPFDFGLTDTSRDSFGSNIFIENIFDENQLLFKAVVNTSVFSDFTDDTKFVPLAGGYRGDEIEGLDLAQVYNALQDTDTYPLKFIFDPTSSDEVITVLENLRNSYQKRCRMLYCSPNISAESIISNPEDTHRGITNNRGMYCYILNWGIHVDTYFGNNFLCSNMGLIAGKLVDVLVAGGGVPAWIDQNGVGGQLGSSITKLSYTSTNAQNEQFEKLGLNPVINDKNYGMMIEGWKTRQVIPLSVYSSIGQSSLADTLIELIENNVLPSIIGKLIDETSFSVVRSGCNSILNAYSQYLEDWYVLCDSSNNTAETRNQQKLILSVGVVFKGYAEKIVFNFVSYVNGTNVEEELSKV